jgi:hypothetical protein
VVAGILLAAPPAASPARAAGGLDVRGSTTYTLAPRDRSVHVQVELRVRNVKPDTDTARFYFTGYGQCIHAEATRVRASIGGRAIKVASDPDSKLCPDFVKLDLPFGRRLFRNQALTLRIDYDLPDGGARSDGDVRVGSAYAAFPAFAYGEERGDVRITLPAGFEPIVFGERMGRDALPDGTVVLASTGIRDPSHWSAAISADRPSALVSEAFDIPGLAGSPRVIVKSWPEDTEWADWVRERMTTGISALGDLIGVAWPLDGPLTVTEAHTESLGGYAGFFDPEKSSIQVSEEFDAQVVLHETSHAWFNDGLLFSDRWVNEGLADAYAWLAADELDLDVPAPPTADRRNEAAFPLMQWSGIEPIVDDSSRAKVEYSYAASYHVIRALIDEIGVPRMRAVLAAALGREIAYVGDGKPELAGSGPADWRRLLDYLEERGGSRQASQLFETWALPPEEHDLLAERADARTELAALRVASDGWQVPLVIRSPMAAWRFADAERQIAVASEVLEERERVEALAGKLGVSTTNALEVAYEGARTQLAPVRALAAEQLLTLETIRAARQAVDAERDPLVSIGLIGEQPDAPLRQAYEEYAADDLPRARAAAAGASGVVAGAAEVGRQRLLFGGTGSGLLLLAVGGGAFVLVRRRRAATLPAQPAGSVPMEPSPEESTGWRPVRPSARWPVEGGEEGDRAP